MFDFNQFNIDPISDSHFLKKGNFIWLIHANKTPPHIGISNHGRYYSLKMDGKDHDSDVDVVFELLKKKKIVTLWVEINSELDATQVDSTFSNYTSCAENNCSCLSPIQKIYSHSKSKAVIFDLLEELNEKNDIKQIFGLNIPPDFKGLEPYEYSAVVNRLNRLVF
jgi:hypothetical protein